MKKIFFILALMLATTINTRGDNFYNDDNDLSFQTFYDELSPYGEWISTSDYGYVWRPYDNGEPFRPYVTRGHWVYTDYGWTWDSDYQWGWAPFHYGRWYFDNYYGWMWVPGNEWAPAWVTWGSYNQCWAWAPMGPNILVSTGINPAAPYFWWTFVPRQHFCSGNWQAYIYRRPVHINNIICINNIYNGHHHGHQGGWFHGPRVGEVERHMHGRVPRMEVAEINRHPRPDGIHDRTDNVRRDHPRSVINGNDNTSRDDIRRDQIRRDNIRRDDGRGSGQVRQDNYTRSERPATVQNSRPPFPGRTPSQVVTDQRTRTSAPSVDSRAIRSSGDSRNSLQATTRQGGQPERPAVKQAERSAPVSRPRNR